MGERETQRGGGGGGTVESGWADQEVGTNAGEKMKEKQGQGAAQETARAPTGEEGRSSEEAGNEGEARTQTER